MTPGDAIFALILLAIFICAILFVLFGQITVRKLRKNPKTKHELGLEFVGGWDILNVAQALSLPKGAIRKIKNSRLSFLEANAEVLFRHTTVFDRCLARVFYWLWMSSTLSAIVYLLLNALGVFD